ncbi:MAG: C25 family cysteine peptidase [Bacteroidota bacterium]
MKKITLVLIAFISLNITFSQYVLTVTKITDPDNFEHSYNFVDSLCDPEMYGSLQWAIRKGNDLGGNCIIVFDIPGVGPHVIALNSYLPPITSTITIDGTTQNGYSFQNPAIIIDGQMNIYDGLYVYDVNNLIFKGLYIRNFLNHGIFAMYCNNFQIVDCVINRIDNGISTTAAMGIRVQGSQQGIIKGNYIGTDITNASTIGNENYGIIFISNPSNSNIIGGTGLNEANIFAYNGIRGIWIGSGNYNKISGNKIYNNPTAISLIGGGNENKTSPIITGYNTTTNLLSGTSQANDIIEIFGSTGAENANEYLTTVNADANGDWNAVITNNYYSNCIATATDAFNNTSQLSNALMAEIPTTQLIPSDCGATDVEFDQVLTAELVPNADQYQFHVFNQSGFDEILSKLVNYFKLSELSNQVKYNTLYNINIRTFNNSGNYSDWGDTCSVTTINPITQLIPSDCGATDITFDQIMTAEEVSFATEYEFWVKCVETGDEKYYITPNNYISLEETGIDLIYNSDYEIYVRAGYNGQWGDFNSMCKNTASRDLLYDRTLITGIGEVNIINGTWKSSTVDDNEDYYDKVGLVNSEYSLAEVGKPKLPVTIERILIPIDVKVDEIIINNTKTDSIAGDYFILPGQPDFIINEEKPNFVKPDTGTYNSPIAYPGELVEIVSEEMVMGYHIVTLQFNVVEYVPISKEIKVYTEIDYSIKYKNEPNIVSKPKYQSQRRYNIVKNIILDAISNDNEFDTNNGGAEYVIENNTRSEISTLNIGHFHDDNINLIPDYIIITDNTLKPTFDELAEYKTLKGVPTIVVTLDEIVANYNGVDNAERVRNYLIDAYNNWGGGLYVLLGGDVEIVPARVCYKSLNGYYTKASDLYFSTTEGDWNTNQNSTFGEQVIDGIGLVADEIQDYYPEHFLGRASVNNIDEAETFVNKVIDYENYVDIVMGSNYANRVLLMSTFGVNTSLSIIQSDGDEYIYLNAYPNASDPNQMLLNRVNGLNEINNGKYNIVYHIDHSTELGMGLNYHINEGMTVGDALNLTNEHYQHILFSNGCSPNTFVMSSISEGFLNNPNGGSVAYIGNSAEGYNTDIPQFTEFLHKIYGDGYQKDFHIGSVFNHVAGYGKQDAYGSHPEGGPRKSRLRLNLLGDPEMPIWTEVPTITLSVSHILTMYNECTNIAISVNNSFIIGEEVTICLYKQNEVYSYQNIIYDGSLITALFNECPNTPGQITVTVTCHNYIPSVTYIDVTPSPDAQLYIANIQYTETTVCNYDNNVDAGENIDLTVSMENNGLSTAFDVNSSISAYTIYESFESSFPPFDWEIVNGSSDWNWKKGSDTYDDPGNNAADWNYLSYFNSTLINGSAQLISPEFIVYNNSLKFWMYHDGTPNPSGNDVLDVYLIVEELSSSSTTSTLLLSISRYSGVVGWNEYILDLSPYSFNISEFDQYRAKIMFEAVLCDDPAIRDIYIDMVSVGSPFVTFTNSNTSYGNINPLSVNNPLFDYNFDVNINTPDETSQLFRIKSTDISSNEYFDDFIVDINKPVLSQYDKTHTFITDINGNGIIENGDIISLQVCLINEGHALTSVLNATLSSTSSDVNISQPISSYNMITSIYEDSNVDDDYNITPFEIEFISGTPTLVDFNLEITDAHGRIWNFTFNLEDVPLITCESIEFENTQNYISFTWDEVSGIQGYNIYRCDVDDNTYIELEPLEKLNLLPFDWEYYMDEDVLVKNVYKYRIHTVSLDGNESDDYCELYAWTSLEYFPSNWPRTTFVGRRHQQVVTTDIDGDLQEEIFLSSNDGPKGSIIGMNNDGTPRFETDGNMTTVGDFDQIYASWSKYICHNGPVIADINNDGVLELIEAYDRTLRVFTNIQNTPDGQDLLWEYNYVDGTTETYTGTCPTDINNSPLLCDFNDDGKLEIVVHELGGKTVIVDCDGTLLYEGGLPEWSFTNPIAIDVDGASDPYMSNSPELFHFATGDGNSKITKIDINSSGVFQSTELQTFTDRNFRSPPIAVDFTGYGDIKLVSVAGDPLNSTQGIVNVWKLDGTLYWPDDKYVDVESTYLMPGITAGDINGDNTPELIFLGNEKLYIWNLDGTPYYEGISGTTSPFILEGISPKLYLKYPLIADMDGDNLNDMIFTCENKIYAFNSFIEQIKYWPLSTIGAIEDNAIISDVNNDGFLELFVSDNSGTIYGWNLNDMNKNNVDWIKPRYNSWNTATYNEMTLDILRLGDLCNGADYEAIPLVSGGKPPYSYLWSTGQTTKNLTNLTAGTTYSLSVTDNIGNTVSHSFEFNNYDFVYYDGDIINSVIAYDNVTGFILGEIVINTGGKLTINNSNITASSIGNIIVEPGGEIILNNTTITSCEGEMWEGITMKTSTSITSGVNEPLVEMNGSLIENARTGIYSNMTGAVQLSGNTFRNNIVDINMYREFLYAIPGMNYHYDDLQNYINNNIFETTAELNDASEYPLYHVKLEFHSMNFKGNTFQNTRTDDYDITKRGIGIYANSSSFKILPECAAYVNIEEECTVGADRNEFTGLYYGLKAHAGYLLSGITLKQAYFNNNYRGAYLGGFKSSKIIYNEFNVGDLGATTNYGLYLSGCSNYKLQKNEFHDGDVGLCINNSGYYYNKVYDNIFYNMNVPNNATSILVHGNNSNYNQGSSSYPGETGLEFLCNNLSSYSYGFAVVDGHIEKVQGNLDLFNFIPTRNVIDHSGCGNATGDFHIENSPLLNYMYCHAENASNSELQCNSAEITNFGWYTTPSNLLCPSLLNTGASVILNPSERLAEYIDEANGAAIAQENLRELIDGGDTDGLLNKVLTVSPGTYKALCNDLMDVAPYISDDVLVEFMENEFKGSPNKKRDVLLACSPLPQVGKDQLQDTWLPPPFKAQVEAQQDGISVRELLEMEVQSIQNDKQESLNHLVYYAINEDATETFKDDLVSQLQSESGFDSKSILIPMLIEKEDVASAEIAISDLQSEITGLPVEMQNEIMDYIHIQEIIIDLIQATESEQDIIVTDNQLFLEGIANNELHPSGVITQYILEEHGISNFEEKIVLPSTQIGNKMMKISNTYNNDEKEFNFGVFPNPTKNKVNVSYYISDVNSEKVIKVFNFEGKLLIEKVIESDSGVMELDVSNLAPSVYMVCITVNGEYRYYEKLSIQ